MRKLELESTLELTDREYELICKCVEDKIMLCDIEINKTLMLGTTEKDLDYWWMVSQRKKELVKLQKKLNEIKKQGEKK